MSSTNACSQLSASITSLIEKIYKRQSLCINDCIQASVWHWHYSAGSRGRWGRRLIYEVTADTDTDGGQSLCRVCPHTAG